MKLLLTVKKLLLLFLFTFTMNSAIAENNSTKSNGARLIDGIDAYHQIRSEKTTTDNEYMNSAFLIGAITGVVGVHKRNNLFESLELSLVIKAEKDKKINSNEKDLAKFGLRFAPLIAMPDNLDMDQYVAILEKYLKNNPEQWSSTVSELITSSLESAFPLISK